MSASILCTTIPGALYLSLPTKIFVWPSFKVVQIWWVSLSGFGDVKSSSHEFSRAWNQGLPHRILLYSIKHTSLPTFQMKFLYFNTNGITKQLLSRCVYFVFFILYSGNLPFIDKLLIILQTSFNPSDITLNWEHVKVVNPLFYILTNPFFVPIPLCDPTQQFTEEKVLILSRAFRKIWSRV